jgi:hypothetical protein
MHRPLELADYAVNAAEGRRVLRIPAALQSLSSWVSLLFPSSRKTRVGRMLSFDHPKIPPVALGCWSESSREDGITPIHLKGERLRFADSTNYVKLLNQNSSLRFIFDGVEFNRCNLDWLDISGVTLRNALFSDCFMPERRNLWEAVEFENVRFEGEMRGSFFIQTFCPESFHQRWENRLSEFYSEVEIVLDLSKARFDQFPTFEGIPAEKVRRGDGQYVVDFEQLREVPHSEYPNSYVGQLCEAKVLSHFWRNGSLNRTGLFIVPLLAEEGKKYIADCEELERLGFLKS